MSAFKFKLPDCDDDVVAPRIFWCIALSIIWLIWIFHYADAVRDAKAAELAAHPPLFSLTSPKTQADAAKGWTIIGGFIGIYGILYVAHFVAIIHVAIQRSIAEKNQHIQSKREQREFEGKMQDMDRENQKQDALSKAAQSKQELIIRLGSIDQYVRVLSIETDVSKRTVALQAAHSEMTTLAAKLASGQISREAVDAPEVREHASETSSDLARLGLKEDRLNRDIIRMFKLGAN